MKRIYLLFVAVTLFCGCEKERKQENASACDLQMKERFKEDLKCTKKNSMEVNLYMGLYENEKVYFTLTMCPNCGIMPPSYGYTCDNIKVDFDDFSNVENIQEVYNSCTKEFKNQLFSDPTYR